MSMEDPSEQQHLSHLPRQTQRSNAPSQLPAADDPSDEELISTFFLKWTERHKHLPKVFDKQGRLLKACNHLQPKIEAAKDERKRQVAADKQRALSLLEAPIGVPTGFNISSPSQTTKEAVVQILPVEPSISSQSGDPNIPSIQQHGHLEGLVEPTRCARPPENPFSSPSQANKSLPTAVTFPTPNKKKQSDLKTYSQRRTQSIKGYLTTAQNHADYGYPGRSLRSGLPAKPSEAFQPCSTTTLTPHKGSAQGFLTHPSAEFYTPWNASPHTPAREHSRSPGRESITVDPFEAQQQTSLSPFSHERRLVLPSPSAREQATAARSVHDKIQQQRSRNSSFCITCRKNSCSCNATREPLEEILCSERDCYKKWWGVVDLWKSCGIKLCDAQETKRIFNCWFCPQCANKARVLLNTVPTSSSYSSSHNPPITVLPEGPGPGHSSLHNGVWPEDAEIREPLQALTGIMQQYTGTNTMARNQLSLINPQTPILDIPCIRDEILPAAGTTQNAISVLRKSLDVPEGILIRQKVTEAKLQGTPCSIWIRGILSFLITDFVFHSGSPFEDATLWRKILAKSGHSPDQVENIIHEYRIRVMKAYEANPEDSDIPPEFRDRLSRRRQAFVEHLNCTMLPLVGGNSDVQARHKKIANIASELNLKVFAYRGTFEDTNPQMNELFDPQHHAVDNPEPGFPDLAGQSILVTTMMGVRFKHPEKGWRTCSPAMVKLWPVNDTVRDAPARVPLPDMPGGKSAKQESRIVPKKRRVGELT